MLNLTLDMFARFFAGLAFMLGLSYYLLTALQWYNYSIWRAFTKHHKWQWHFYFLFIPLGVFSLLYYYATPLILLFAVLVYVGILAYWTHSLTHRLKWTHKIWRFFGIYIVFLAFTAVLHRALVLPFLLTYFAPFLFSFIVWEIYEKVLFNSYHKLAIAKLERLRARGLKVITITGSYGKTSIKNFVAQILAHHFSVYATPRSVNTFKGLVSDVNERLSESGVELYITEAGARQRGDIEEISNFLMPEYAIIGEIGPQHLEYFKSLENIRNTKFELLKSPKLQRAFCYFKSAPRDSKNLGKKLDLFGSEISGVEADLNGIKFSMEIDGVKQDFNCAILGAFNVINIAAAIKIALVLGMGVEQIKKAVAALQSVEHRLQKIAEHPKLIIDDSFNGNLNGMLEGVRLASLYPGRRIIVTPGIIEANSAMNEQLAKKIDEVFDIAIITGSLNNRILSANISHAQKILLEDKMQLENMLSACSAAGDLILFSNDAPNYI